MSTLANTKWSASVQEGGTQTWTFNSDGTMNLLAPNGQNTTCYYAELSDGTFIFQIPKSSTNPNINNVYFGRHKNGSGIGDWVHYEGNGNESVLLPFSMSKSS